MRGYVPLPTFLAFAFFDGKQTFTPAQLATVPNIGTWVYHSIDCSGKGSDIRIFEEAQVRLAGAR